MSTTPAQSKLAADLADVRRTFVSLAAEGRVDELIEHAIALLVRMRDDNTAVTARLGKALRELYGRKSEKITSAQLLLLFTDLAEQLASDPALSGLLTSPESGLAAASEPTDPPAPPPPPPTNPKRPGGGRSPLPAHLPRETRVVAVPEAERACAICGAEKKCVGHSTSEILEFVPAQFRVIEEKREKLECPRCPEQAVTALSEKVMDRGRPGPGLLALVLVEKFDDGMPLYRQSLKLARYGMRISDSTLGEWSAFSLDVLAPLAECVRERVLRTFYVRADDTGMRVLDRMHPNGVKRGHIWGFVGDGLVYFSYAPDWRADHPAALLNGFSGYLQGDGYAGYAAMLRDGKRGEPIVPEERRLGCGMHIRSKFEKLARAKDARGAMAITFFKAIYRVEQSCKDDGLCPEERHARRQEMSIPIVDKMYAWIHDIHASAVPGTQLFAATQYAINQERAFRRCFTDGRFEIDNGEVERRIRPIAVGRKGYLFAGSDKGAQRLAVGYTLFGSCRMHSANSFEWANDVIEKMQSGWPRSRLAELLPDVWARQRLAAAAVTPGIVAV